MDIGRIIMGFVFLVFGGLNIVKPEIYLDFQKWVFKTIYGAGFKPSDRTIRVNKFFGIFFILLGFLVLIY